MNRRSFLGATALAPVGAVGLLAEMSAPAQVGEIAAVEGLGAYTSASVAASIAASIAAAQVAIAEVEASVALVNAL